MRFSTFKYFISESVSGLLKNRLMSVASIATVAACIFIMSVSYCIVSNLQYMLEQLEDSVGVAVFLEDDLSSEDIIKIQEKIGILEHVTRVVYISPEDALNELKEEWNAAEVLDGFTAENNPLSHSFEIEIDNIANQGTVVNDIQKLEGVRNIRNAQTQVDFILRLNKVMSSVGAFMILLLAVISIVIIVNTIKISVFTRSEEINIMKYVGATDWFVRWPFIIEGIIIGLVGAIVPIGVAWPIYSKIINVIYTSIPVLANWVKFRYAADIFTVLLPASLFFGVFLGVVGSVASIRKHLRV